MTGYIATEQIHRWKSEYPSWRMSPLIMNNKKNKGLNVPDFCGPNESYQEWLKGQERLETEMLDWTTNQYDIRNYIPEYMQNYKISNIKDKILNL